MKKETNANWTEMKSRVMSRFGKLTDEAVESARENLDLLSVKIQKAYGYAREQADKEVAAFKATLHEATEPNKKPTNDKSPKKVA